MKPLTEYGKRVETRDPGSGLSGMKKPTSRRKVGGARFKNSPASGDTTFLDQQLRIIGSETFRLIMQPHA